MSRFYQRPAGSLGVALWCGSVCSSYPLCGMHAFLATSAQAQPSVSENELADVFREHAPFAPEDPRTIFARARACARA